MPRRSISSSCVLALVFFTAACGPGDLPGQDEVAGDQTDDADTQDASTSTSTDSGTGSTGSTGSSDSTTTTSDGGTFIDDGDCVDGCDEAFLCDLVAQDCPEGDKCVPDAAAISWSWDGSVCVPVTGSGEIGDPCASMGIDVPNDDCGADSFCWMLDPPIEGGFTGTCVPFCQGDGQCAEGYACHGFGTELSYCVPTCEPLLQDCVEGQGCYFVGEAFICVETIEPEADGTCSVLNSCAAGSLCVTQEFLVECPGNACCAELCDLSQGDGPCQAIDPAYVCRPFYEEGAPPGLVDLGVCLLPA